LTYLREGPVKNASKRGGMSGRVLSFTNRARESALTAL